MFVPFSSLLITWLYLTSVIALYQTCRIKNSQFGICTSIKDCWQLRKKEFHNIHKWGTCGKWYNFMICCPIHPLQGCGQIVKLKDISKRRKRFRSDNPLIFPSYPFVLRSYANEFTHVIAQRIVNGKEPPIGSWPWLASLGSAEDSQRINWSCGATLITYSHLLTAAHCVCNGNRPIIIRLGAHDMYNKERSMPRDIKVKKIDCHQLYTSNNLYHDIAIIELEVPQVNLTNIKPVCLPTGQPSDRFGEGIPNQKVSVAGWGQTSQDGDRSHLLQQVNLTIITHEYCNNILQMNTESREYFPLGVTNELLCTQDLISSGNSCKGDSGGPVVYIDKRTGRNTLIGITSGGDGCGLVGGVGINTRVVKYLSWIYEHIGLI